MGGGMITPHEARALIHRHARTPTVRKVRLSECFRSVLAADVAAPFPMPVADNSAMDGYVIRSRDAAKSSAERPVFLRIVGTLKAGDSKLIRVMAGTACRIMTGAFMARDGDAVIPKEDAVIKGNYLSVSSSVPNGQHIRRRGEEIKKGQLLLRKGTMLNPAAVGILAAFGYAEITVYEKPKVTVLATGSELVRPGKKLSRGKIYDSNSWMIRAALSQMGVEPFRVFTLRDDIKQVRNAIRSSLRECDYLLLLGGVSVGDYDVVKEALKRERVKTIFWKVSQKPGKPLYFGRKGKKIIFGLPGNPAAVFTCFYEYVYPALLKTLGYGKTELQQKTVNVENCISADPKRHLFLKAKILNGKLYKKPIARVLSHQGSHMLSSLVEADGFLRVPASKSKALKNRQFQMDFLPYKVHV